MKQFKINIFSLILLFISMITFISDILCFINVPYLLSLIISIIINLSIFLVLKKKIIIYKNITKYDLIFYLILLFILLTQIPYPDLRFDTINYHLYLQERPFIDKIFIDFFAGRCINTYTAVFSNRVFYIFRYILGYRIGTIFNYFLIIYMYNILKEWLKKLNINKELIVTIISTIILFTASILELLNSYYIDIYSAALLMFLLDLAINKQDNKIANYLFMIISSFCFITKLSNAYLIILAGIVYLINNYKFILKSRIIDYLLYILVFMIPIIFYSYDSFTATGNPFFPFYNSIFKSKYYFNNNWMDNVYGPYNIFEVLIWPIYALFNLARVNDSRVYEPIWAIAYIIIIINIIYSIKKNNKKNLYINLIAFMSYFLWAKFLIGYSRYAIITLIIGSLIYYVSLYKNIEIIIKNKYKNCIKNIIIVTILILLSIFNTYKSLSYYFIKQSEGTIDNIFTTEFKTYKFNIKNIFARYEDKISFPKNSCLGVIDNNAGDALLVNNEIDILNLTYGALTDEGIKTLQNRLKEYDHIYIPVNYKNIVIYINFLSKNGYKIKNFYKSVKSSKFYDDTNIYLYEIIPTNENFTMHTDLIDNYIIKNKNNSNNISFDVLTFLDYKDTKSSVLRVKYINKNKIIKEESIKITNKYMNINLNTKDIDEIELNYFVLQDKNLIKNIILNLNYHE